MKPDQPTPAAALRKRAEEQACLNAAQAPENLAALTPAETQALLHELQVHQIELEMQNEELRAAQNDLYDLYDLTPVGYCTLSQKGLILEANLAAASLLGAARAALIQQPISRFILKEDHDIYYCFRKQLFETSKPQTCELRLLKKDDMPFWAQLVATAAQDKDGEPIRRLLMSDISERKRAEEALNQKGLLLMQAESISHIGSWRLDLETGKATWSDEMYNIFGLERASPGHDMSEVFALAVHPQDRLEVNEVSLAVLQDGIPRALDYRIVRPDGAIRWVHAQGKKEFDSSGRLTAHLGVVQDITERKQTEEALRESEQKYRLLHESAGVGIGYYTPEGVVISFNKIATQHMNGRPEDFEGKSIYEIFPKVAADFYLDRIKRAVRSEFAQKYEDRVDLPTDIKWFHSTFTRILNSTGNVIGVQIISTDITERKQAEDVIRASEARFRATIEQSFDGILIVDQAFQIIEWNSAQTNICGFSRVEMIGKALWDFQLAVLPDEQKSAGFLEEM